MRLSLVAIAGALIGCNAIFGIDDLAFEPATAGATGAPTGTGGDGASAGTGGLGAGGTGGEAGAGATGGSSGGAGGAPPLGPFGAASPVDEINSAADDDDPTFTEDMLELYFNSTRGSSTDIWRSTRLSPDDPWGPPVEVAELNSIESDSNPIVSPDGLTLWQCSRRDTAPFEIYVSTRTSRSAAWSTPEIVPEVNSTAGDYPGAVTADGLTFFFSSSRSGGAGSTDAYFATRPTTDQAWGGVSPLGGINTSSDETALWLPPNGLLIYFDSDRSGQSADLYRAQRTNGQSAFSAVEPVSELNTPDTEADPWLSVDTRYIMFVRGTPPRDIYHATR
jgi:hypothetical protein